jgi:hypothetical protein
MSKLPNPMIILDLQEIAIFKLRSISLPSTYNMTRNFDTCVAWSQSPHSSQFSSIHQNTKLWELCWIKLCDLLDIDYCCHFFLYENIFLKQSPQESSLQQAPSFTICNIHNIHMHLLFEIVALSNYGKWLQFLQHGFQSKFHYLVVITVYQEETGMITR